MLKSAGIVTTVILFITFTITPEEVTLPTTSHTLPASMEPDTPATLPASSVNIRPQTSPTKTLLRSDKKVNVPLQQRIELLMQKALLAKSNQEFSKSIMLYNQIIALLENSHDFQELEWYSKAHFLKASVQEFNLHDKDEAIKTYDQLIEKLKQHNTPEVIELTVKAQLYEASMLQQENALAIYDDIIERFKNSIDPNLLKNYASAQFAKSYLLKNDEALAIYDDIITKFSRVEDKELLQQFYQAQANKAYILEHALKDTSAALEVYDEIIEHFSRYEGEEYQERVENALFKKSFILMEEHNEDQAMKIFDDLIEAYQEKNNGEFPKNFEYAIVNNIELALISGNDDNRYQELARTYLQNTNDAHPQIDMLDILKNAQEIDQEDALDAWKERYPDFYFQNWSFDQLEIWQSGIKDAEAKERVRKYLDAFEGHNNHVVYQSPYQSSNPETNVTVSSY